MKVRLRIVLKSELIRFRRVVKPHKIWVDSVTKISGDRGSNWGKQMNVCMTGVHERFWKGVCWGNEVGR